MPPPVPVIAIDGPTASGKGTIAQRVADALGFHYLDSGALYRVTALAALRAGVATTEAAAVAAVAAALPVAFPGGRIELGGEDVGDAIRAESISEAASIVAAHPAVRAALLDRQRAFRKAPGLVSDGRDMGSVVFPDAVLKVFLTASAEIRAQRRHKQLMEKGLAANLPAILHDLRMRDARDSGRAVAPLQAGAPEAVLDSDGLTIEQVVAIVLERYDLAVRVQASGRSAGAGGSTLQG
ncbi:MAG: (d)CMP kinase [Betaproteobacteria bacterium]|jgi:cytidylate kinase|nr:(d)CMP kinase [Betaproteobacteria bacterium]